MPKIGEVVVFIVNNEFDKKNDHEDHPAIITNVWSETCVNIKVFYDCGPVEDKTSIYYKDGKVSYDLEKL